MRRLRILAISASAVSMGGCGSTSDTDGSNSDDSSSYMYDASRPDYILPEGMSLEEFQFLKGSPAVAGLTAKVHKPSIRVCLYDPENIQSRKDVVRNSLLKWVNALAPVTTKPLTSAIEFVAANASGCDVYVSYGNYSPAYTNLGKTPRVNVARSGWFGSETVILHEFGHAFGLLDTYNGSGGSCKPGQPASVMCYAKYKEPMQDDILGVQSMYRDVIKP